MENLIKEVCRTIRAALDSNGRTARLAILIVVAAIVWRVGR
jgi:hypothetical protein